MSDDKIPETMTATMAAMKQHVGLDFRERRARDMAVSLTKTLVDVVPYDALLDVQRRLYDVLYHHSAAWTTEDERRAFGLDPRDDRGWTGPEKQDYLKALSEVKAPKFLGEDWGA